MSVKSGPVAQRLEQWTHNPLVVGSNPTGPTTQTPENKRVTKTDQQSSKSEKEKVAKLLQDNPDLQRLIKAWPMFSPEGKHIVLRLVELIEGIVDKP